MSQNLDYPKNGQTLNRVENCSTYPTWYDFEAAKPAPWLSQGLHHLGKNSLSPKIRLLVEDAVACACVSWIRELTFWRSHEDAVAYACVSWIRELTFWRSHEDAVAYACVS